MQGIVLELTASTVLCLNALVSLLSSAEVQHTQASSHGLLLRFLRRKSDCQDVVEASVGFEILWKAGVVHGWISSIVAPACHGAQVHLRAFAGFVIQAVRSLYAPCAIQDVTIRMLSI